MKVFIIILTFSYFLYAEKINREISLEGWNASIKFTPPKRACSNCNFTISFPIDHQLLENQIINKIVFMHSNIQEAYNEILLHRGVLTCMYCGDLYRVTDILPQANWQKFEVNGVTYHYSSLKDSYKIEIMDDTCGVTDTLLFLKRGDIVELWSHSKFSC